MQKIVILLKTYKGDIDYIKRLIESFKKYNHDKIPLYIVVPSIDLSLFKKFVDKNIKLLSDESITTDLVYDNSIWGIRPGYINQEIIKLSFWKKGLCKNYFCMDSDGVFIRNFYVSDFMYDENTPYTILSEDHELIVDPQYYKDYWCERERLIKRIQKKIGLTDRRMLTSHGFAILSCKVLESFYKKYLLPNKLRYTDILKIAPYEFSWYNMWLQKDKTIPIEFKDPLIKLFYQKSQHLEYLNRGITVKDISRGYIGYVINSNYSRGYGVLDYSEGNRYTPSLEDIKSATFSIVRYFYIKFSKSLKRVFNLFKQL
jgi:hypothetical protein